MKTKDQTLLEEAYKKVTASPDIFRDKKKNSINQGDRVTFDSKTFKIVGGKTSLGSSITTDKIQIEQEHEEDLKPGQTPKLLWVRPNQVTKI